jgi:hypothetical protein
MKIYNLLLLLFAVAFCKAQITLRAEDFPNPADTFLLEGWLNPSKPTLSPDNLWNFANLGIPTDSYQVVFNEEDLDFFKNAGIDVYRSSTKDFNANFFYYLDLEFDLNENGLQERGIYVPQQRYSLSPYTGNTLDSLIIQTQGYLYNTSVDHLLFPLSYKKSWSSSGRRAVNFNLTVNAFGLNNIPAQHVWYTLRKDTVISYGTMQIMTPEGVSRKYDVLVDQIETHTIDSFYLAGSPAPPVLLNNFGLVQGQKTNFGNRINFYRKDLFYYFASYYFGDRAFNAQPYEFFTCLNGAQSHTSSVSDSHDKFSFTVFPTMLQSAQYLNLLVSGAKYDMCIYTLTDMEGRTVKKGMLENGILQQVESTVFSSSGFYIVTIQDNTGKYITHEKIQKY